MTIPTLIAPGLNNHWSDSRYNAFEHRVLRKAFKFINYTSYKKSYHVSLITQRNIILAVAENLENKTDSEAALAGYYAGKQHSEFRVLKQLGVWHQSYDFYNVRCNKNGEIVGSRPCARCQKLLRRYGINSVIFTNDEGFFEELPL